ncbi:MAG: tandem-95 repeat protein, partial [Magnetococcales bacterium]|nr:tandem-95 repeat protein [Magnetococcales bacterium]
YNGSDTLTITTSDLGNSGSGGALTDSDSVAITVNPVNDAPLQRVMATVTVAEDGSTGFTVEGNSGISVSDATDTQQTNASDGLVTTVSVLHGVLTAGAGSGATVTADGTATVTMAGTAAQINAALSGLTYQPTAHYNGSDTLTITTSDQGHTGGGVLTDSDAVAITVTPVNDAPLHTLQASTVAVDEDQSLTFSTANQNRLMVSDGTDTGQDGATDGLSTVVSVAHGVLSVAAGSEVTITGNGTASITLAGSAARINAVLDGLIYTPSAHYNGSDTLTITTSDLGNSGSGGALTDSDSVAITVNPVNDAPTNSLTVSTVTTDEDTPFIFYVDYETGILVADLHDTTQNGAIDTLSVVVSVQHGTLMAAPGSEVEVSMHGDGTAEIIMVGMADQINAALNGLTYLPTAHFNGTDLFTITTRDLGNTGGNELQDTDTVAITVNAVNDAPVVGGEQTDLTGTDQQAVNPFAHVTILDVETEQPLTIILTFDAMHGEFTSDSLIDAGFTVETPGTVTFTGSASAAQIALRSLLFMPTGNLVEVGQTVTTQFSLVVSDGQSMANSWQIGWIATAVNDSPVIDDTASGQSVTDKQTCIPFATISVTDADPNQTQQLTIRHNSANGHFSTASLNATGVTASATSGEYHFSGTAAQLQTALRALVFQPTPDQIEVGRSVTTAFTLTVTDSAQAQVTDATTSIVVASINDAPTNSRTVDDLELREGEVVTLTIAADTFADQDPNDLLEYRLTLADGGELPGCMTFQSDTRTLIIQSGSEDSGTYGLRLSVVDQSGATASTGFTVHVTDVPAPPPPPPPPGPDTLPPEAPPVSEAGPTATVVTFVSTGPNLDLHTGPTAPVITFNQPELPTTINPTTPDTMDHHDALFVPPPAPPPGPTGNEPAPPAGFIPPPAPPPSGNEAAFTPANSFTVFASTPPAGGITGIFVHKGIPDVNLGGGESSRLQFAIPTTAFGHSDNNVSVQLSAQQADGSALPPWLRFNPATGEFSGTPPAGMTGELAIKVVARDGDGREALVVFKVKVGAGSGTSEQPPQPDGQPPTQEGNPSDQRTEQEQPPVVVKPWMARVNENSSLKRMLNGKPSFTGQLAATGRDGLLQKAAAIQRAAERLTTLKG